MDGISSFISYIYSLENSHVPLKNSGWKLEDELHPYLEMIQFHYYFSDGLKPPTRSDHGTFSLASPKILAPRGPATPWRPCRLAGAWAEESAPSPRCGAVGVRRCTGARWEFWEEVGEGVGWWGWLIWIEMIYIYMYTYITYFVEEPKIWIYIYIQMMCALIFCLRWR